MPISKLRLCSTSLQSSIKATLTDGQKRTIPLDDKLMLTKEATDKHSMILLQRVGEALHPVHYQYRQMLGHLLDSEYSERALTFSLHTNTTIQIRPYFGMGLS